MKSWHVIVLLLVLACPDLLKAQKWTDEEKEVLDSIRVCWDAWEDATRRKDFDIWLAKCKPAEDYSMWWTNLGTPSSLESDRRTFEFISSLNESWVDFHPVAIRIHGDVAIVQFYGYWQPTVDGKKTITQYKRTEVFQKVNGRWTFLGGQGSPVSSEDSKPYE